MGRLFVYTLTLLAFLIAGTTAQAQKTTTGEKDKATTGKSDSKKGAQATITKVDAEKGTIMVKMKDKNGKDVDKTFTLTEDVRMVDSTDRAARIDVFQSGEEILVIEAEGKLREVHKKGGSTTTKDKSK